METVVWLIVWPCPKWLWGRGEGKCWLNVRPWTIAFLTTRNKGYLNCISSHEDQHGCLPRIVLFPVNNKFIRKSVKATISGNWAIVWDGIGQRSQMLLAFGSTENWVFIDLGTKWQETEWSSILQLNVLIIQREEDSVQHFRSACQPGCS